MKHPTLLTMPNWFGMPEVKIMPGSPEDYRIEQVHKDWFEVWGPGNERMYSGLGPVTVQHATSSCRR